MEAKKMGNNQEELKRIQAQLDQLQLNLAGMHHKLGHNKQHPLLNNDVDEDDEGDAFEPIETRHSTELPTIKYLGSFELLVSGHSLKTTQRQFFKAFDKLHQRHLKMHKRPHNIY